MSKKKKIMIVEDDVEMRRVMKRKFEISDYLVCVASDGEKVMEVLLEEKPDLIILDILLPKKDGYKICSELKNHKLYRHIPIIMHTALGLDLHKEVGIDLGADAYVAKTAGLDEVLEKIKELLNK